MRSLKLLILFSSLLIFFATASFAEDIEALEGRSLLKAFRELHGRVEKSAYETRKKELEKASEKIEQTITSIEEKETEVAVAEPNKEISAVVTETPVQSVEKTDSALVTKAVRAVSSDRLLLLIPEGSLFVLRVNNFEYTINQLDQFLAGVSPMPLGLSMQVRMSLAGVLGSPDLKGVNMNGSFVVFALPPSTEVESDAQANPLFFLLLPITDYKTFVSENTNVSEPNSEGLSEISVGGAPVFLAKRILNFILIAPREQKDMIVSIADSIAAGGRGLAAAIEDAPAKDASAKPIWFYVNTQLASGLVGESYSAQLDSAAALSGGIIPPQMIIEGEKNLKGLRFVSIAIQPKPQVLNAAITFGALQGTETAAKLAADSPAMLDFIKLTGAVKPADAGEKLAEISSLLPTAKDADFIGTFNLMKLIEAAAAGTGTSEPQTAPQAEGGLAFVIKCDKDQLTADIALPKEYLAEVMMAALAQTQVGTFDTGTSGEISFEQGEDITKIEVPVSAEAGTVIALTRKVDFPQMFGKQNDGSYVLPLLTRLPMPVVAVTGGELKTAVGEDGKDLLPPGQWSRQLNFLELAEDGKTVSFGVEVLYPNDQIKVLKELTGSLTYLTSSGTKTVDSGSIDFKVGASIKGIGAVIRSLADSQLYQGGTDLVIQVNMPPEAVLSAKIYSQDGKQLDARKTSWNRVRESSEVTFTVPGKMPPSGRIVLELGENVRENKIDFKSKDISLAIEKK